MRWSFLFSVMLLVATTAMADRTAFLAAIAAAPRDFTGRLAFADWLDENGDSDRATFIRAQIFVEQHGSMLHWGRPLIGGDDSERVPLPRAFVSGDSFFDAEDQNVFLYQSVEKAAVLHAERLSRTLFQKNWRRWVAEIAPGLRRRLRPAFETDPTATQRHLFLLSGQPASSEMIWWYTRFRAGFFGAVRVGDFEAGAEDTYETIFSSELSTVIELYVEGTERSRWLDYVRAHPASLRRLHSLSLWTPLSNDTGRTDALAAALFGEQALRKGLSKLENLRLVTSYVDETRALRLGSLATGPFALHLDRWMVAARPKRFFLTHVHEAPSMAQSILERLIDKKRASFSRGLATLALTVFPTTAPPIKASTDYLQSLSSLDTFHLGAGTFSEAREHTIAHYATLARLPQLRVLSWDVASNFAPPEPAADDFPSLREEPCHGWHPRMTEIFTAIIERNHDRCPESLAELAFVTKT